MMKKENIFKKNIWLPQRTLANFLGIHQSTLFRADAASRNWPKGSYSLFSKIRQMVEQILPGNPNENDLSYIKSRNLKLIKKYTRSIAALDYHIHLATQKLDVMKKNDLMCANTRSLLSQLEIADLPVDGAEFRDTVLKLHSLLLAKKWVTCDTVAQELLQQEITAMQARIEWERGMLSQMKAQVGQ